MPESIDVKTLAEALRIAMNPTKAEQAKFAEREPGRPHDRIPCVSPTGARFTAVVAKSDGFPDKGRVKTLEDYVYPSDEAFFGPGVHHYMTDQFGMPDKTRLTPEAQSHRYRNTYKADLMAYVGKPFDIMIAADKQEQIATMRAELAADEARKTAAIVAPQGKGK